MAELLMGDEAVAVAALDAGIRGAFSYPGTPATEIFECIRSRAGDSLAAGWETDSSSGAGPGIVGTALPTSAPPGGTAPLNPAPPGVAARWSANEKIAYEEALGVSYLGGRSIVSMKHVGLNVAADPFMSSALTGALGGLVVAVADDPGMHSSQNEQDTRCYAEFARVPLFEPSNQQECYDATRLAFELSEELGIPIVIRLVTRLAHSRAPVVRSAPSEPRPLDKRGDSANWILLPVNARRRNRKLIAFQETLVHTSERLPFNELTLRGPKGIIVCGIGNNYVREAIGENSNYSVLKIGTYPVPATQLRWLVDHCSEILVVEDGYPFVEMKLRGLLGVPGKFIRGRCSGELPPDGELNTNLVRSALGLLDGRRRDGGGHSPLKPGVAEGHGPLKPGFAGAGLGQIQADSDLPARPPCLCQGCPHCDTFQMINDALPPGVKPLLFGDIGCYTLGALPPYNAVDTCVEMGASVGMALGAAKVGAHPVICTIGDSTFTHSGMGAVLAAARENANMTVLILDNAGIAMTGGQDVFVTGEDFIRLLRGLGVDAHRIIQIDPVKKEHAHNVLLLKEAIAYPGLSVVIATRPCIHMKRRAYDPAPAARVRQLRARPA